jgi:hypothetical protein
MMLLSLAKALKKKKNVGMPGNQTFSRIIKRVH